MDSQDHPSQSELYARSCHGKAGKAEILLEIISAERAIHTVLSQADESTEIQ